MVKFLRTLFLICNKSLQLDIFEKSTNYKHLLIKVFLKKNEKNIKEYKMKAEVRAERKALPLGRWNLIFKIITINSIKITFRLQL